MEIQDSIKSVIDESSMTKLNTLLTAKIRNYASRFNGSVLISTKLNGGRIVVSIEKGGSTPGVENTVNSIVSDTINEFMAGVAKNV